MKTKKLKIFHSSFFIATLFSIILNQISHSYASTPSVGTLVSWTDDTFFDTYSSGSGVTTTDLPDTNSLTWQMFYSYAPLRLSVDTNRLGVNTWRSGSNTWKWRVAISSADDTIGSWGTETDFATGSASYTAGGVTQNAITTQVNIPSNRYFLIGIYNGPYYKSYKQLNANRTAQISGVNYFTSISNIYHAAHGSGVLSGIPSAIGGNSSSFTTYANYSLVSTIKFKATGTPAAPDTTAPTFTSSSSFSAAENISTSSNAATIKVSESATVTISAGADAARFNIVA